MIDGKLTEVGREPPNVQVVVQREVEGGRAYLYLQDASGVFLESELDSELSAHGTEKEAETGEEEADEVDTLKQAQRRMLHWLERWREGLQKQMDRVKELWKLNCEQLAEHDSIIAAKDVEISSLRARVEEITMHEHAPGEESPATTGVRLIDPPDDTSHQGPRDRMSPNPRPPGPRPPIPHHGKAPPVDSLTGKTRKFVSMIGFLH